jgi:hypothetical protein
MQAGLLTEVLTSVLGSAPTSQLFGSAAIRLTFHANHLAPAWKKPPNLSPTQYRPADGLHFPSPFFDASCQPVVTLKVLATSGRSLSLPRSHCNSRTAQFILAGVELA